MTKQSLKIFLFVSLVLLGAGVAYAVPDGRGNELFPKENVGIGTMTPVGALAVMNGNVGIGTWVPGGALEIEGGNVGIGVHNPVSELNLAVQSTTGTRGLAVDQYTNDSSGAEAVWRKARGTLTSPSAVHSGDVLGFFGFRGYTSADSFPLTSSAYIQAVAADNFTSSAQGGYLQFGTTPSGSTANEISMEIDQNGNVGIGTTTPTGGLVVMNGNVGIGTWVPGGALEIEGGNVGIGSTAPGEALDVQGTTRTTGFQLSTNPSAGYVLTSNSVGVGTWMPAGSSSQWTTTNTNDVYLPNSGNVGIGTTITNAGAALTVMNGNVGIGTWAPSAALTIKQTSDSIPGLLITNPSGRTGYIGYSSTYGFQIGPTSGSLDNMLVGNSSGTFDISFITQHSTAMKIDSKSNVGIGTTTPQGGLTVMNGNVGIGTWVPGGALEIEGGNVGIGSTAPGVALDVNGTVRATSFSGITSSQWATQDSTDVSLAGGNVGIGTTKTTTAALTVMNGNVGIGTWVPSAPLVVKAVSSPAMNVSGQYFSQKYTTTTTLDWNKGNVQYIQLASGAQTFTFANPQDGGRYILVLKQPSSGAAGTITWPGTVLWPGSTAPTLTSTNSKTDIVSFIYDGTNSKYYGNFSLNY